MWFAADIDNKIHNDMCHICAKELLDSNFNEAVIYKMSNFKEITQISHTCIHKDHNFLQLELLRQPILPYRFHCMNMQGTYLFIFASCEP